jgi:hypothetical protein
VIPIFDKVVVFVCAILRLYIPDSSLRSILLNGVELLLSCGLPITVKFIGGLNNTSLKEQDA